MGIRVNKSIGWGLELDEPQVDTDRFMALADGDAYLSYCGFLDFVRDLDYPLKGLSDELLNSVHSEHRDDEMFDGSWSQGFFQCVHGEYDPETREDDEVERFLVMTPYATTHNALTTSLPDPVLEGDEAFLYAEFEVLFPDASPYTNQSYTFKTPPFPDSYEVVGVTDDISSVRDLVFLSNSDESKGHLSLIRNALMGRLFEDNSNLQELFEDVVDVNNWQLSAPFMNMALVEYSGILRDPQQVFKMKPRVLYYWT